MRYKLIETTTATGLAYWASYLINGDAPGLSDDDRAEADAWLASVQPTEPGRHAAIVSCGDESSLGRFFAPGLPSHGKLADLLEYVLHVHEIERDTREYRDHLARQTIAPGARVRVLTAYMGSGRYAPDGTEGEYVVLGLLRGGNDYYLARLPADDLGRPYMPSDLVLDTLRWDIICHASRLEVVTSEEG